MLPPEEADGTDEVIINGQMTKRRRGGKYIYMELLVSPPVKMHLLKVQRPALPLRELVPRMERQKLSGILGQ